MLVVARPASPIANFKFTLQRAAQIALQSENMIPLNEAPPMPQDEAISTTPPIQNKTAKNFKKVNCYRRIQSESKKTNAGAELNTAVTIEGDVKARAHV